MDESSKAIAFTNHARDRCFQRGAAEADVVRAIREGKREPAQRGLWQYRLNLEFQREWAGNWYAVQQIAPVVAEEEQRFVVITVYTLYF
jgi:hypothetical protein